MPTIGKASLAWQDKMFAMRNQERGGRVYSEEHRGQGRPDCGTCQGLGYVTYEVPEFHPDFGKMFSCDCTVGTDTHRQRLAAACGLSPAELAEYSTLWQREGREEAEAAIQQWVNRDTGWFLIVGPAGVGKTAMGMWMVQQRIGEFKRARYLTVEGYLQSLRDGLGDFSLSALRQDLEAVPFLVADELENIRSTSPFVQDQVFALVNARYRLRHEKATVWIFTPQGLATLESEFPLEFDRAQDTDDWVMIDMASLRGRMEE